MRAAAAVDGYDISAQAGEGVEGHIVTIAGTPPQSFSTDLFKSPDYATLGELWEKVAPTAKGPTAARMFPHGWPVETRGSTGSTWRKR